MTPRDCLSSDSSSSLPGPSDLETFRSLCPAPANTIQPQVFPNGLGCSCERTSNVECNPPQPQPAQADRLALNIPPFVGGHLAHETGLREVRSNCDRPNGPLAQLGGSGPSRAAMDVEALASQVANLRSQLKQVDAALKNRLSNPTCGGDSVEETSGMTAVASRSPRFTLKVTTRVEIGLAECVPPFEVNVSCAEEDRGKGHA